MNHDLERFQHAMLLCHMCYELKLSGSIVLLGPFEHAETLREEQDVLLRKKFTAMDGEKLCPLCRLATSALRSSAAAGERVDWDGMGCTLYLTRFSSY
jgi:hypothetical protein